MINKSIVSFKLGLSSLLLSVVLLTIFVWSCKTDESFKYNHNIYLGQYGRTIVLSGIQLQDTVQILDSNRELVLDLKGWPKYFLAKERLISSNSISNIQEYRCCDSIVYKGINAIDFSGESSIKYDTIYYPQEIKIGTK